jgi:hypothetical protein
MPYKDPEKQKAAARAWAERNKEITNQRTRDRRNNIKKFLRDYKADNSICTDCNISYPPHILDFDHLGDKEFQLSGTVANGKTIEVIKKEIEKCEIVCSNCHRHRTYMRSVNQPKAGTKRIELSS